MTIRAGHDDSGHRSRAARRARSPVPGGPQKPRTKRPGIQRQTYRTRIAQDLPLTERHDAILALVNPDAPTSPRVIADALDLPVAGVTSSLYALQDRGLVTRIQYKGWTRLI